MKNFTALPTFIATLFKSMPIIFRHKHKAYFIWLVLLQCSGIALSDNLSSLSKLAPKRIAEWHFRRLLTASYWSIKLIMYWLSEKVIAKLPKPENGIIYLTVDGSHKNKRSKQNPFAQKGKLTIKGNYFFGIKFVVLMVNWGNFRVPIDFDIVLPKKSKNYMTENQLFREMLKKYTPQPWVKQVIILADAGFASKDNFYLINKLHNDFIKKKVKLWYVFAISKNCKTSDGQFVKNIAKHTNKEHFKKIFIPKINKDSKKSYWCFSKKLTLKNIGDVTMVFSRKRRNSGPKQTKVLVTNHPEFNAKTIVAIYQRRFLIEVLFKELKSQLGLGKHQVTKNTNRIINSFGISFISYLLLLNSCYKEIPNKGNWSILKLQYVFREKLMAHQFRIDVKKSMRKENMAA